MSKRIEVKPNECTGCMACVLECSLNKTGFFSYKNALMKVKKREEAFSFPIMCSNCIEKSCIEACEFDAIKLDTDFKIPLIDKDECTGCGKCVESCKYGLIRFDETKETPVKCDFCGGKPVCCDVCISEAIKIYSSD